MRLIINARGSFGIDMTNFCFLVKRKSLEKENLDESQITGTS